MELGFLGGERAAVGVDRLLLVRQRRLGALDDGREVVAFEHLLENPVLEPLDLGFSERDFVLDGVVFLVGLHGHRLLAEFRQPALVERDVFFDLAPRRLTFGEAFLGRGEFGARGFEPRIECLLAVRVFRDAPLGRVDRRVETLEGDQLFEIFEHK